MEQYKEYLKNIITTYWAEANYRWFFLIGLAALFFLIKDQKKRAVFFWYPLLVYLFMISPAFYYVGQKLWSNESVGYYYRQFSLVPIFIVIAAALAMALKKLPSIAKLPMVAVVCAALIYFGSPFMYEHPFYGFEQSDNLSKIPGDLIAVCDYMDSVDKDPVVVMSADLSALARQYDASLHLMVEAREYSNRLSVETSSENPDVEYLMERCCNEGTDYVVVKNLESVRGCFSNFGYAPCFETSKYLLYECSGYPGIIYNFDEQDRVVSKDER